MAAPHVYVDESRLEGAPSAPRKSILLCSGQRAPEDVHRDKFESAWLEWTALEWWVGRVFAVPSGPASVRIVFHELGGIGVRVMRRHISEWKFDAYDQGEHETEWARYNMQANEAFKEEDGSLTFFEGQGPALDFLAIKGAVGRLW